MNKQDYIAPETKELKVRLETKLLQGSVPAGARSVGFTEKGDYDDEDWDIS